MTTTYLASTANLAWKVIKSYGIDPERLFETAQIDRDKVMKAGCRISYRSIEKLWELMIKQIDDPCIGLRAADYWHPSYLNALGYAWLASSTLYEAFNCLARYIHIVTETIELEIDKRRNELELIVHYNSSSREVPQRADAKLATFMAMSRINYGDELNPLEVWFKHSAPVCEEDFHLFFRAPVHFDQAHNSITFRAADMGQRLAGANPYIAEINSKIVVEYLSHLHKGDILQRTKAIIVEKLPSGNVSNEVVAGKLFMSVRSFQRALQNTGVTYRSVLADTRRELAEKYIRDPDVELQEVAFLLGFTEYSAFSRAFKQWTGNSPVQIRTMEEQRVTIH